MEKVRQFCARPPRDIDAEKFHWMAFSNSGRLVFSTNYSQFQKELLMNKNRFAKPVSVAVGFVFLCAVPGLALVLSAPPDTVQTPKTASPGTRPKRDALPPDDFAALNYTDEQKAEIDRIHRETESHKAVVAKDEKLTADQKEAMLVGYTRMEYGLVYKVLSPEQRREVRQRLIARRAADQAAQKKQSLRN
jgi:hypothetical protein